MSNRNNDVFQVLVTSGNQALLAAGATEDTLAVGQLGCFDADTGLSVTTATKSFYFAVGLGASGGTLEDIRRSAGQFIQRKGISALSFKPHTAGRPNVWKVSGYKATCDTDYAVKVEFRNSRIYKLQGFSNFTKTYAVRSACCDGCGDGCDTGASNDLTIKLFNEINNDVKQMLTAQITARQAVTSATHGTSVNYAINAVMTVADARALDTYNALSTTTDAQKVYTDLVIISKPLAIPASNTTPNLHFHKFIETAIIVSLVDGFLCAGTATEAQTLALEEGTGNSIRQKEYHASAWNGAGPYVVSDTTSTGKDIPLYALNAGKYDQFALEYFFTTESGWLEYSNTLSTIFAVPEADTVTRNALATLLDLETVTLGFEALADDAAAASVTPTVIEPQPANATKDGIA